MTFIISHRGIFDSENTSLESIKKCIDNDIGLEIDLRINEDSIYISHDSKKPSLFFNDVCSILSNTNVQIALHIKELDVILNTLKILRKNKINNFFLFTIENYKISTDENFNVAYYANSFPNNISDKIIWCDESVTKWFNSESISNLKNKNNKLIAISQEIFTNCSLNNAESYWNFLYDLGFDGICTNFPMDCKSFFLRLGEKI